MGRKPNALIHEFFERGAKLEDSSNRYQHTCKSCGEKFPKGRIDSLTNHLIKNCPAVSQADRQRAIASLNQKANEPILYQQSLAEFNHDQSIPTDPNFPPHPSMSALETLAEVSRQQLDSNGQYVQITQNPKKRKRGIGQKDTESEPQMLPPTDLLLQETHFGGLGIPATESDAEMNDFASVLRGIEQYASDQSFALATTSAHHSTQILNLPTIPMIPDQLALAASAATEIMPKVEADDDPSDLLNTTQGSDGTPYFQYSIPDEPSLIDPQLHNDGHSNQQESHLQMQMQVPNMEMMTLEPSLSSANLMLPHAQYLHDFSLNGDPHKSKTRGRFTPNRRKEVQEVRRQGACIRCRMLKKPCSGGTPCSTCINVESARLWKSPCMRARIADEFDLFTAGLNTILSFHEVNHLKARASFENAPYMIEATHFPTAQLVPAPLPTIRGLKATSPTRDVTAVGFEDPNQPTAVDVELLNQDSDNIPQVLDQYIRRVARKVFEREPSQFMRPTLMLASELASSKLDPLLNRALELWAGTVLLVDPNLHWHLDSITFTPTEADMGARRSENLAVTSPLSYRILTHQLRGHLEKRCSLLAKSLMNDLERRLLQRGHASGYHFETFLTSVILLNCVEKMCWLFNTWNAKLAMRISLNQNTSNGQIDLSAATNAALSPWPFDRDPQSYVAKGDIVADVLSMLLKMRAVPPSVTFGEDGVIHFDASASAGRAARDAGGPHQQLQQGGFEQNAAVAAWFEGIALRAEDLERARDTPKWDATDCRCWEMRYVSRLILPDGP